jgi:hypothetical protein
MIGLLGAWAWTVYQRLEAIERRLSAFSDEE